MTVSTLQNYTSRQTQYIGLQLTMELQELHSQSL